MIQLSVPLYSDFLESRSCLHTDFFITLNEGYCLPANRILLAASSQYFEYLLKQSPALQELSIDLPEGHFGDVRVFQVLLNYLERGEAIVPEGLDETCWISLMQLADYFCIAIRGLCEGELVQRICGQNCEQLLEFSLREGLEDLQAHCLEFIFRRIMQQGGKALREIRDKQERSGRESALYEFYRLWEFDLEQFQLKRREEGVSGKPQQVPVHSKENVPGVLF